MPTKQFKNIKKIWEIRLNIFLSIFTSDHNLIMDFTSNYKKKGMALDQEGKRIMRVKRRSVDQRSQRDTTFMRHRDVQKLAPLKENLDANVQRSTLPPTGKKRQVKTALPYQVRRIPRHNV